MDKLTKQDVTDAVIDALKLVGFDPDDHLEAQKDMAFLRWARKTAYIFLGGLALSAISGGKAAVAAIKELVQ